MTITLNPDGTITVESDNDGLLPYGAVILDETDVAELVQAVSS